MHIYNVTTNIEESAHEEWLQWMKETHIPEVLATGKFLSAKMCRVLVEEEMGGFTYSVQYTTTDKETLQKYAVEDAPRLRQKALERFGGNSVSFRTEMEVVVESHRMPISATQYLFTYGTLQEEKIQWEVFGRTLQGSTDKLMGFKLAEEKIAGTYPIIGRSHSTTDELVGKVYLITPKELQHADHYEGDCYQRIPVVLASGIKAWVYTEK